MLRELREFRAEFREFRAEFRTQSNSLYDAYTSSIYQIQQKPYPLNVPQCEEAALSQKDTSCTECGMRSVMKAELATTAGLQERTYR